MEVSLDKLTKHYKSKIAVDCVSATMTPGVYGLLGANGAGKTTLMRMLCGILEPTSGDVHYNGRSIFEMGSAYRNLLGYLPQEFGYYPNYTAQEFLLYISALKGIPRYNAKKQSRALLETVGLENVATKKIKTFSGGMKQRAVIAIALACNPGLLFADEPTTALDVTIQAQVLDLIAELREKYNTAMLLITHDMGVVAQVCDEVAVIYAGQIIEYGSKQQIFDHPSHPYTIGLFGAIPSMKEDEEWLRPIEGLPPDPSNLPEGCAFHPRCPYATEECNRKPIEMYQTSDGHQCRCCHMDAVKKGE